MSTVRPDTNFHECGDTDLMSFTKAISRTWDGKGKSAMAQEAAAIFTAVQGYSRLCAAVSWMEVKNLTWPQTPIPFGSHNAWAVKCSGGWCFYPTFEAAAKAWVAHITNTSTFPQNFSVTDFINKYAPAWDGNNPPQYIATIVAEMNALPDAGITPPPPPAKSDGEKVADVAEAQLGKAYVPAGSGPNGFDCSGLVAYCVKQALGIDISHDSHAQFALGKDVSKTALQPGDTLYYDTQEGREVRNNNTASHVGIYVGNGQMVNALNKDAGVIVSDPFSNYFAPLFLGARRAIWSTGVQPPGPDNPLPEPTFPFADWPKQFVRHIVTKPVGSSGQGWNQVQPKRGDRLTHFVVHHTAGGPGFTKDSCWSLFSIGGQRVLQALTEGCIDRDGSGYLFNDPWSADPLEGSGRSPWASGPATALSDVGAQYVRKYGADAVNDRGFSIEHCNAAGERWSDAMMDTGAKVYATVLTRRKVSYKTFPVNDAGLWVAYHHDDFAPTECPNIPSDQWEEYKAGIQAEMKKLQVPGSITPPGPNPPPPPPVEPTTYTHLGLSEAQVSAYFGLMKQIDENGKVTPLQFNPKGPLSLLWLARCDRESIFPAADTLQVFDSKLAPGKEYFAHWVNGWTAWLPIDNARATWEWLDSAAPSSVFLPMPTAYREGAIRRALSE